MSRVCPAGRFSLTACCFRRGFTLIEMIMVMALIAVFTGVIGYAFMRGGNSTIGLQSAQSTVTGLLALARGEAAVSGRNAGLLVCIDPGVHPDRYLRYLVPVVRDEADSTWVALTEGVYLPAGCYVVPTPAPSGSQVESGADWTNVNSTALGAQPAQALNAASTEGEAWSGTIFTSRGTTADLGRLVLATGRPNPPSVTPAFVFVNPHNVRGVIVSQYGLTRLVNDESGFLP